MINKIEKIMKRLKTFSKEELELITEVDCSGALEELLLSGKLQFVGKIYEYIEPKAETFEVIYFKNGDYKPISVFVASETFLKRHVQKHCKTWTLKTYISIFKTNILPYFKDKNLAELELDDVLDFYKWLKTKNLSDLRVKNTMALLNQLLKYFQEEGVIDRRCEFKVQRLDSRKSKLKNVI